VWVHNFCLQAQPCPQELFNYLLTEIIMVQIIHKGQHLLRHKAQEVGYTNATYPSIINVKTALDEAFTLIGTVLSWQAPVADRASLPLTGNVVNDARVVQDDGDGSAAIYVCIATTGTVDQQWIKIADVDWQGTETVTITNTDSPYTADVYNVILADTSAGDITVVLPASATSKDKSYTVKKITNDSGQITVDPNASETIDGDTTKVIGQYRAAMKVVCDASNWHII
jgi:hypothetical protein